MNSIKILTISALAAQLAGCGAFKAIDAVQHMDKTTSNLQGSTDSMKDTMTKKMDDQYTGTVPAIHDQTLDVALKDMYDPINTRYITTSSTTPTAILPAAKIFGETATPQEIIELTYAKLLEINTAPIDDSLIDPATHKFPAAVIAKSDNEKWITFTILSAIAGMAPQAKIEQLIKENISADSRYEHTAYNILWLRHSFIHTFMLDMSLMTEIFDGPGYYEQAFEYIDQLKYIEGLPFAGQISLKLMGFTNRSLNGTMDIAGQNATKDYYPELKTRLTKQLAGRFQHPTEQRDLDRMSKIRAIVTAGAAAAESKVPAPTPKPVH